MFTISDLLMQRQNQQQPEVPGATERKAEAIAAVSPRSRQTEQPQQQEPQQEMPHEQQPQVQGMQ